MAMPDFVEKVRAYCTRLPASVISWGRTAEHTKAVGGFVGDPHTHWFGVDVEYDAVPELSEAQAVAQSLGLVVLREGHTNGDHLQPRDWSHES